MRRPLNFIVLGAVVILLLTTSGGAKGQGQDSALEQPRVVRAVAAIYPHIAAVAGASGTITVDLEIYSTGAVKSVRLVNGLKILGKAAEQSASRWVFTPASESGSLRSVRLTYVFKLMPSSAAPEDLSAVFDPPFRIEVRAALPREIHLVTPKQSKSSQRRSK
jgi:TonB family protein